MSSSEVAVLYVAGPMSGLPDDNYPAFMDAAFRLRDCGYHVVSPHEPGRVPGWRWGDYMRRGLLSMLSVGPNLCGIATLPDMFEVDPNLPPSVGLSVECQLARALDISVHSLDYWIALLPHLNLCRSQPSPGRKDYLYVARDNLLSVLGKLDCRG